MVVVLTLVTEVVLHTVRPERAGSASAVMETSGELGGALGIAVLGSIGAAVYGTAIATNLPQGLPQTAADAAGQTLAEATVVAAHLPTPSKTVVLAAARNAFVNGLNTVSIVGAVLLLAAAAALLALLHDRPQSAQPAPESPLARPADPNSPIATSTQVVE